MAKKIYKSTLLKKLADKLGKKESYVVQQISKRAKSYSPEAYFVYWLTKEKINSRIYQRGLSESIRKEIQDLLNKEIQTKTKTVVIKKIEKKVLYKIDGLNIEKKPPLIDDKLIKEANENAQTYQALYILENSIRNLIILVLEKQIDINWWHSKGIVPKPIKDNVSFKKENEKMNAFHGKRGVHEIFYTDFSELSTILKNNAKHFNNLFKGITGRLSFLTQKLEELSLSRNALAHTCPLSKRNRNRFVGYLEDLYDEFEQIVNKI